MPVRDHRQTSSYLAMYNEVGEPAKNAIVFTNQTAGVLEANGKQTERNSKHDDEEEAATSTLRRAAGKCCDRHLISGKLDQITVPF
ncbi:unnamed protein product [Ceratitis capitata]|uniref:(Mediterranean fruit fly) hypothetical protein n=1 Tax=Ceratitis capitata TaxID=7213 RepID=A0A811V5W6_CERCA|nr:unnamed protein product [Ceratitis capitata]